MEEDHQTTRLVQAYKEQNERRQCRQERRERRQEQQRKLEEAQQEIQAQQRREQEEQRKIQEQQKRQAEQEQRQQQLQRRSRGADDGNFTAPRKSCTEEATALVGAWIREKDQDAYVVKINNLQSGLTTTLKHYERLANKWNGLKQYHGMIERVSSE